MTIVNEMKNYRLNYMENVKLCHTILLLWNHTMADRNSMSEKIYNIADSLSKKYPREESETELLDFTDEINKKEYDIIKQRLNNRPSPVISINI